MQSTPQTIIGSAGELELIIQSPPTPKKTVAIICHPHPLHGGTMNNKVVTTLVRTFNEVNTTAIRFNFRGVGKSEGVFAEGVGELEDLLTVITWVNLNYPDHEIALSGFSFGGFIATLGATKIPAKLLITIAPQVSRFQEINLPPITCPWILVQGEKDEIISAEEVFAWVETLNPKPTVIRMPEAGHFFHGQLVELRTRLLACIGE